MYAADLPWGVQTSIVMIAVMVKRDYKIIQGSPYIDDPGPTKISLMPSGQIVGTVELARRFPRLPRIAMEDDLVIFWTYQAKTIKGQRSNRTSGALTISDNNRTDR
jgi:hypothetical protein